MLEKLVTAGHILGKSLKVALITYGIFLGYKHYDLIYSFTNKINRTYNDFVDRELEMDKTYFLRKIVEIKYSEK
jgi:hypothetical protein